MRHALVSATQNTSAPIQKMLVVSKSSESLTMDTNNNNDIGKQNIEQPHHGSIASHPVPQHEPVHIALGEGTSN
jgi:hypothetical protein